MAVSKNGLLGVCLVVALTGSIMSVTSILKLDGQVKELTNQVQQQREKIEGYQKQLKDNKENLSNTEKELETLEQDYKGLQNKYKKYTNSVSYNPSNLKQKSNASTEQLSIALKGTRLEGLADTFIKAENEYGVNALFLTSLVANESAWGTSARAINDNNMSGYQVYSASSRGARFSSKQESIMRTARLISEDYLNPNGKYHNGTSLRDVNIMYSQDGGKPNRHWSETIGSIANDLEKEINIKRAR